MYPFETILLKIDHFLHFPKFMVFNKQVDVPKIEVQGLRSLNQEFTS